jgi:hypothetical protein
MVGAFSGGQGGGGGAGNSGGLWMAIIEKALGRVEGRKQTAAMSDAARASIPSDPAFLLPFIQQMGADGTALRNAKVPQRLEASARVAGNRAATGRGLSGPLAASVEAQSVDEATDAFEQWRQQALSGSRDRYLQLVREYMEALEARRQASVRAGYAEREAHLSKIPGILGGFIGRAGIDQGWWEPQYNSKNLDQRGAYSTPAFAQF